MTEDTRISGTSTSAIDLIIASPSLQPILSWNVTDSPKCSDHCMITVNIQSKNSERKITITKFNINKAKWHLFTSNETWKKITKNLNLREICNTNDRNKETLP